MKKIIILIFFLCFVCSCMMVPIAKFEALEKRVSELEKGKLVQQRNVMLLAQEAGAAKFWWRSALLGNTSSTIDGITGASNGDAAMMVSLDETVATGYIYVYDADGAYSDYPVSCTTNCTRIAADGMTVGAWVLADWYSRRNVSTAPDGYHYFQAVNTVDFVDTPTEGMCYWKDTASNDNDLCCYDADVAMWRCVSFD